MHRKFVKVSTVVGSFLLITPTGISWFWGNMSVYALSYIVYRQPSASSVQAPWIMSIFLISWTGSLLACNFVSQLFERRMVILFAILISNLATFMSYFTIQHSMALLTLSYSVITGLAMGILYGNAFYLVIQCADKDVGILTSIVQSAFSSGSIIITQLVTWYCNPNNKIPDMKLGSTVYFTQKEVLDKVPSMFLVVGSFSLATQTVAVILLQYNPEIKCDTCLKHDERESQPITETYQQDREDKSMSNSVSLDSSKDKTPKEVLKSISFYFLWLSLFFNDFPFVLLMNYYKLFGQIWIHDDIFLANVGTAMLFSSFIFRLVWGTGIDKLGVKFSFLCLFGSLSVLSFWYYFTAIVNRWLYFTATLTFGGISSSIFSCYMTGTAVLFGKTHVSTHIGMLMTASMVFNGIAPELLKTIIINFGWFFTFATSGFLNLLNLLLCLIFIGND